jgi:hypothetical protein
MKAQVGWRLDRLLLEKFAESCKAEDLRPSESVEEFMRRSMEAGGVAQALSLIVGMEPKARLARELRAQMIVSDISGALKVQDLLDNWVDYYQKTYRELLALLPTIQDAQLVEKIKALAVEVNATLGRERRQKSGHP